MYLLLCELYFRCYFNYPCAMLPIFMCISFKICQILANFKKRLSAIKLRLSAHCSKLWPSASLTLSAFLNIVKKTRVGVAVFERRDAGALPSDRALHGGHAEIGELELFEQPLLRRRERSVLTRLVKAQDQHTGYGELVPNVARGLGAPAREAAQWPGGV